MEEQNKPCAQRIVNIAKFQNALKEATAEMQNSYGMNDIGVLTMHFMLTILNDIEEIETNPEGNWHNETIKNITDAVEMRSRTWSKFSNS